MPRVKVVMRTPWTSADGMGQEKITKSGLCVSQAINLAGVRPVPRRIVPCPFPELLTATRLSQMNRRSLGRRGGARLSSSPSFSVLDQPLGTHTTNPQRTGGRPIDPSLETADNDSYRQQHFNRTDPTVRMVNPNSGGGGNRTRVRGRTGQSLYRFSSPFALARTAGV